MNATLRLEAIGDNHVASMRHSHKLASAVVSREEAALLRPPYRQPWVAEITGTDPRFGFARKFLSGRKDYSEANSIGSRGVHLYYELTPGVYEVNDLVSWSRTRRYFCRVGEDGSRQEIPEAEVRRCLEQSANT